MRIYDINPTDGTVIDPAGRVAPLDPMRRQPRIPAGATSIEPPATGTNEAARWVSDAWEVVPDWRGYIYWLADGSRHEITELGEEPPADALDEAPPEPLEDLAARKRMETDIARDQAFAGGLPYDIAGEPDVVQTRPQDQINLLGLSSKAQRLIADGVTDAVMPFRGQSNVTRMLTPEQMDAMTLAALAHIEGIYQQSWDRKDAIDAALAAGDRDAIEAISW